MPSLFSEYHELGTAGSLLSRARGFASGLIVILAVFLTLFCIGQTLRYGLHVFYGLGRTIPGAWPPISLFLTMGAILYVAESFGGLYLLTSVFFVLLTLYQSPQERVATIVMTLCLALIPTALSFLARSSYSVQTTADQIQYALDDPTDERALSIRSEEFGHIGSVTYAVALKKRGEIEQSEAHLDSIDLDSLTPELQV